MKITKAKLSRHLDLYKQCTKQPLEHVGNIQYALFDYGKQKVLYLAGSNEPKDWAVNLMYIGVFFHLGYYLMARKIGKKIKNEKDVIIVGHSFGAAVGAILSWIKRKNILYSVLLGCPACYTVANPIYLKNMYNYRVKGDLIGFSKLLNPFMRQPRPVIRLPRQFDGIESSHSRIGYELAFEQKIRESEPII